MKPFPKDTVLLDLEVSSHLGYVYEHYEASLIRLERMQILLSFSWKWYREDRIHTHALPDYRTWKKSHFDDSELVKELWKVMDRANIIVCHNAVKFDVKKANTRFIMNNLDPPKPYKVLDTLKIARRHFSFPGNSLDSLAQFLKIGKKIEVSGKDIEKNCLEGHKKSWSLLRKYNAHDVYLLEGIYKRMLPYVQNFPVVYIHNGTCRKCHGTHFQKRGFSYANTFCRRQFQCMGCGGWSVGDKLPLNE